MKLENFDLHSQRNAGHYQYLTDFKESVIKYTPQALGIKEAYEAFVTLYESEGVALVAITKSATSEQIDVADKDRDFTFRGLVDKVRNGLNHFDPKVQEAAKRALIIFDSYGNLAPKPDDEESGLIISLIADLRTKLADSDRVLLEISVWIDELERRNNLFITLQATRNSEEANRNELRMKQVRVEIDAVYRKIVERINALIVINGEVGYTDFVKEINNRISRARVAIALSRAQRKKTDDTDVKA